MKTMAMIVGMVGAMFMTSPYVLAQAASQQLGAAGGARQSDKDIGGAGAGHSTNQKLGTPGASSDSDKDIGTSDGRHPTNQKLGAPGASPESDKNIGPGATDSTTGSDNKSTNRRSAPPTGKK